MTNLKGMRTNHNILLTQQNFIFSFADSAELKSIKGDDC